MMRLAVCLKWVDLRPEIDALTGEVTDDDRFFGVSLADQAALAWALRIRTSWARHESVEIVAVTAGDERSEDALRDALATGADQARHIAVNPDLNSQAIAAALRPAIDDADLVLCGDWSVDRGSGSVPAFLAGLRGATQALGLVSLAPGRPGELIVERRLDFGRRERLAVRCPAVLSVEGGTAELRRAPMAGLLAARAAPIAQFASDVSADGRLQLSAGAAYRPRARVFPAPNSALSARDRILSLTGALVERTPPRTVTLDPEAAADLFLDQLRDWGYLAPTDATDA